MEFIPVTVLSVRPN